MNTSRLMAGASRFAHLAGFVRSPRRAAEGDDDRQDDEPKGKKGRAADDDDDGKDDDDDQPKGKKGRKAADDDDEDDQPKGKKGRRADDDDDGCDDDDDKEEMSGKSAKAQARQRERERVGAILGHSAAARNPALAASLAVETTLTRREAIAVLNGQADRAPSERRRESRSDRNPDLGAGGGREGKPKAGSSWDRSLAKLGIKPRQA